MPFHPTARAAALAILPVVLALPAFADDATKRPMPRPDAPVYADLPSAPTVPFVDFIGPRQQAAIKTARISPDAG